MKVGIIRGASKRLLRQWSSRSTLSVDQPKPTVIDPTPIPRTRRHVRHNVRFSDRLEEIPAGRSLSEKDIQKRWYSNGEIDAFKQQLGDLVRDVRTDDGKHPSAFARSIQKMYLSVGNVNSMEEVFRIVRKTKMVFPEELVGLEKHVLTTKALQAKKRELVEEALFWENATNPESMEQLRIACRDHSRGARYFAYVVAERAASVAASSNSQSGHTTATNDS